MADQKPGAMRLLMVAGRDKAPFNERYNNARVYTYEDTAVMTPNSDAPYSFAWLDLRAEPTRTISVNLTCAAQAALLGVRSAEGPNPDSSLGAARPLPPRADIGPGGQSAGQAAQFCLVSWPSSTWPSVLR